MKNEYNSCYIKLSETQPEHIRKLMISLVGEKSKEKLYNNLKDLEEIYPDFENWFYSKVIPELELKNGQREIIVVISEDKNTKKSVLSGIAILKKTIDQKKICTFRVHKDYRNQGIGTLLFKACFEYLETEMPVISISEKILDEFESHIKKFHFELTTIHDSYYKNGIKEYVYNGSL